MTRLRSTNIDREAAGDSAFANQIRHLASNLSTLVTGWEETGCMPAAFNPLGKHATVAIRAVGIS